jgi:Uma2 family endonuclease
MISSKLTPMVPSAPVARERIPKLQNGDHLTLAEFERRYSADPLVKKAELIDGIVYMASPTRFPQHSSPHFAMIGWLDRYVEWTPGTDGGAEGTVRIDPKNMPQPDVLLFVKPEYGGRVRISDDDYLVGAPELIVEIAASSVSFDLYQKFEVYQRNGVNEYVVWRVEDDAIDWFMLEASVYKPLTASEGVIRSVQFPGLWLDAVAMLALDRARVSQVLSQGIAQPEHAAFVQKLEQQKVSS